MKKSMVYKILYYIIFLATIGFVVFTKRKINTYMVSIETSANVLLTVVNLILAIIFTIKIKRKLININFLFPIIHIIFMISVIVLLFMMNDKLLFPYMHFTYYLSFILFNYALFNLYSVISINKR